MVQQQPKPQGMILTFGNYVGRAVFSMFRKVEHENRSAFRTYCSDVQTSGQIRIRSERDRQTLLRKLKQGAAATALRAAVRVRGVG